MVRKVTDRDAVEAALDEFDRIGRASFLEKHNFGPALSYFIERDSKHYDSKAIYGAAHQLQFPDDGAISSNDFSGGAQAVVSPLRALGYKFAAEDGNHSEQLVEAGSFSMSSRDLHLIAGTTDKKKYADLSDEERAAYSRTTEALRLLGVRLKSRLINSDEFDLRLTSGFSIKGGVRGYIPKDLWFSISPKANAQDLAGMPQLFMIVSERGVEYGFGASVSPNDFSAQTVKDSVRRAAPIIFAKLPKAASAEAGELQSKVEASGRWYFRRKHRLAPGQTDFPTLTSWLAFLQSDSGGKNAAGTISRYLLIDEVETTDFSAEVDEMARLFEHLIDRDWHRRTDSADVEPISAVSVGEDIASNRFATLLSNFIRIYGERRSFAFAIDDELGQAMKRLQTWLQDTLPAASRPTITVKISVGQGGWTRTPWIALLDSRETTTTQHGIYVVFLISEDLAVTYLTLNQGMTNLRNDLGQKGAALEMVRVAEAARPLITDLESQGFHLNNNIDLRSNTGAAKNYEIGTIAYRALPSDELPDDDLLQVYLEDALSGYDRLIDRRMEEPLPDQTAAAPQINRAAPFTVDDALEELFLERVDVERYIEIWLRKKNLILQGAPGVGKSFTARLLAYALIGFRDDRRVQTVQFHQSYSYEDFVQGYRPNGSQGFERKDGSFYEFCTRAAKDPDGRYVFIIDEINRGNLSKIFGELMLLIEADKRDPKWATRLAYAANDDPEFYVPSNLYVLGMMNTADRSLSLVDYALRRRFAFVAMDPLYDTPKFKEHLATRGVPDEMARRIVSRMGELNQAIENDRANLGAGFRIGHSFFTPSAPVGDAGGWYRRIIETELHPLLQEYWFDTPETADQWRDRLLE
jgi:MoxR-like ATPase